MMGVFFGWSGVIRGFISDSFDKKNRTILVHKYSFRDIHFKYGVLKILIWKFITKMCCMCFFDDLEWSGASIVTHSTTNAPISVHKYSFREIHFCYWVLKKLIWKLSTILSCLFFFGHLEQSGASIITHLMKNTPILVYKYSFFEIHF